MFFLHILILYHLLEEVIFTLYYLYTTTNDEGYEEEPYINEDREPEIADDEETEEDD